MVRLTERVKIKQVQCTYCCNPVRFLSLCLLALVAGPFTVANISANENREVAECSALATVDFSAIPDAPTRVLSTRYVNSTDSLPAHCVVNGYVAPQVQFVLKLPEKGRWNGNFFEQGIGGTGGTIIEQYCDHPLRRGYACITTDTGHTSALEDGLWANNNFQGLIDYTFRAIHVIALAGKALTEHFYDSAPRYSYFMGCSRGGIRLL